MKIINLTPHTIKIKKGEEIISIKPSENIARVGTIEEVIGDVDGIPIINRKFGDVEGLPEPQENVI